MKLDVDKLSIKLLFPLKLRTISVQDDSFLRHLYRSTRADELAILPWSDAQKNDFIRMQFDAQHQFYQTHYSHASFEIIQLLNVDIGRLFVDLRDKEIRIIDIALLPDYRGRGYGYTVLSTIQSEAQARHLPILIHVEKNNPALSLYERMQFEFLEDKGVYNLLRWEPKPADEYANQA